MLGARAITTQSECQWLEDLYRDKVMVVAKKMVAKQQARDLARQQMESVSHNHCIVNVSLKLCWPTRAKILYMHIILCYIVTVVPMQCCTAVVFLNKCISDSTVLLT